MRNLVFLDLGHLGICLTLVLETGIPSCGSSQFLFVSTRKQEAYRSWWGHELQQSCPVVPVSTLVISGTRVVITDLGSSLEDDGFVARTFRVCKCAYGLCALVFKPGEKLVELLDTERLHEPFAV